MKHTILIYCVLLFSLQSVAKEETLKKTIQIQKQGLQEARSSQKKVDSLDSQRQDLLREYRLTLKKIDNTRTYNKQLREFIVEQREEMKSLRKQIEQVKDTGKDILPLMLKMIDSLEQFVELDVPFLLSERKDRVKKLKEIIKRADVSVSEKYRRVLSAYQVENEYGRTLSSYKGLQDVKGKDLTVDFLRVGRIALIYQTLDKKHTGFWDIKQKKWVALSSSYKKSVSKALAVARKQSAPDLLKLPVFTPVLQESNSELQLEEELKQESKSELKQESKPKKKVDLKPKQE